MALQVVSTPAISTRAATPNTTLSSTGAPSNSEWSSSLSRSSPGSDLRRATSSMKKPIRPSMPCRRRAWSSANSRASRTHSVKVSDNALGTPRMEAITRTGICWA